MTDQEKSEYMDSNKIFDARVVILSLIFVTGIFMDGWAHDNVDSTLETFLTPWHAVLYSGFLLTAGFIVGNWVKNFRKGKTFKHALPKGYFQSILGIIVFALGGVGDGFWHEIFGIEEGSEALYSPTHLLLAIGGALILSGPLVSAMKNHAEWSERNGFFRYTPVLSATFVLLAFNFFSQDVHPLNKFYFHANSSDSINLGLFGILFSSFVLVNIVLILVKNFELPKGSLFLVIGFQGMYLGTQNAFKLENYTISVLTSVVAGLIIEIYFHFNGLNGQAKNDEYRTKYLLFFGLLPVIQTVVYFIVIFALSTIAWSIHIWGGAILLSGIIGWFTTYQSLQ